MVEAALLIGVAPVALLALAATLWAALLLQAFGAAWPSAVVCVTAAGGAGAVTFLHLPPGPVAALTLCGGAAALCLSVSVLWLLGRPAPHA